MLTRRFAASLAAVGLSASLAAATPYVEFPLVDGQGEDSGWKVQGPDFLSVSVTCDDVYKQGDQDDWYVLLQVSKKYRAAPDAQGNFPPIVLAFTQTADDANTVPHIRIADEAMTNQTGEDWHDFHWILYQHEYAAFDTSIPIYVDDPCVSFPPPGVFDVYPFTAYAWDLTGVDTQKLNVSGGVIPAGGVWFPGILSNGYLQIDVDLPGAPSEFSFDLKQLPTPEPATFTVLAVGAAALLRRRRSRR
jgi:MYXO-CTERM domain-containing protein